MLLASLAHGQQRFRVYFSDKGSSQALLTQPHRILSPAALERRAWRQIPLDGSDLPVAPEYLEALRQKGAEVLMHSRWFNYAKVETGLTAEELQSEAFVRRVEPVEAYRVNLAFRSQHVASDTLDYGFARPQIEQVHGHYLHEHGWLGQGMRIAVLDGGFMGSQNIPGLDSMWQQGRVKMTYNFVQNDTNIFVDGSHGTGVLSVLAGYHPGQYAGSAIKADYYLFKTEFEASETPSEMDNWLRAAEWADSLGVDIISSSLGYNKFDGGQGDYAYSDMDGNTTLVTRAADKAAEKGLLVIVSAGNEGSDPWKHITAPADGDSVLAVGAVNALGLYASFSSQGPTADGRIKPDVMARGQATALLVPAGPTFSNGTSYACPIVSGLAACLWQSQPSLSNMDIFEAIRGNAAHPYAPDNKMGFGLANFRDASWSISLPRSPRPEKLEFEVYPNPLSEDYFLEARGLTGTSEVEVRIYDLAGQVISVQEVMLTNNRPVQLRAPRQAGTYLLTISTAQVTVVKRVIR